MISDLDTANEVPVKRKVKKPSSSSSDSESQDLGEGKSKSNNLFFNLFLICVKSQTPTRLIFCQIFQSINFQISVLFGEKCL
jgi:hypothetical protein